MSKQTYPKRVKGGNLQYKTHCGIDIISTTVFEQSYNIWFHTYILTYILYTINNRINWWTDQEITIQTDTNVPHIVVMHIQFYNSIECI
jgi:hypothetical protein